MKTDTHKNVTYPLEDCGNFWGPEDGAEGRE